MCTEMSEMSSRNVDTWAAWTEQPNNHKCARKLLSVVLCRKTLFFLGRTDHTLHEAKHGPNQMLNSRKIQSVAGCAVLNNRTRWKTCPWKCSSLRSSLGLGELCCQIRGIKKTTTQATSVRSAASAPVPVTVLTRGLRRVATQIGAHNPRVGGEDEDNTRSNKRPEEAKTLQRCQQMANRSVNLKVWFGNTCQQGLSVPPQGIRSRSQKKRNEMQVWSIFTGCTPAENLPSLPFLCGSFDEGGKAVDC